MSNRELKEALREAALELGFRKVGFAAAQALTPEGEQLHDWLASGMAGEMGYMAKEPATRADPSRLFPEARTVMVCALDYHTPYPEAQAPMAARISRYAQGEDYHEVLKERLQRLAEAIDRLMPGSRHRSWVDTGPIMEKAWAARAGVGWVGKHGNVILPREGSWVFLGAVLLEVALPPDAAATARCGRCTRCIPACPTGAIVAPGVVDARRCISYLTIELKGAIPRELRKELGNRVFGCDDCQEACPWNRFARPTREGAFLPRLGAPALVGLLALDAEGFRARFRGSAIKRAKRRGLLRNVAVALGNSGDAAAIAPLATALGDEEPLVRGHAAWALGELATLAPDTVARMLGDRLDVEPDPRVREELALAIAAVDMKKR